MPPVKKPSAKAPLSIKDMLKQKADDLLKKQKAEEAAIDKSSNIVLPEFFAIHTDILPVQRCEENLRGDAFYRCTKMARVWFRNHSNLDAVVSAVDKTNIKKPYPEEAYISSVIRSVTSAPSRKHKGPYKKFRFDFPKNEIIGRTLLINPQIRSQEHLEEFFKFQNHHNLKLCEVSLSTNNLVHTYAKEYIENTQENMARNNPKKYEEKEIFRAIQRKYYESQGLIETLYLKDLSVEELENISNFEEVCLRLMEENEEPESRYTIYAESLLNYVKNKPGGSHISHHFVVNPRYNLIGNIMTIEEQNFVAETYRNFYDQTNAAKTHKRLYDGSTRLQFYEKYVALSDEDRKMPPFNHLFFREKEVVEQKEPTGPSQVSYGNARERFVRTNPPQSQTVGLDGESSSSPSVLQSSLVVKLLVETVTDLPTFFIVDPKPSTEELELMRILSDDNRFVYYAKRSLSKLYPLNFEAVYRKYRTFILMNFIHVRWEKDPKDLKKIATRCAFGTIMKSLPIIENQIACVASGGKKKADAKDLNASEAKKMNIKVEKVNLSAVEEPNVAADELEIEEEVANNEEEEANVEDERNPAAERSKTIPHQDISMREDPFGEVAHPSDVLLTSTPTVPVIKVVKNEKLSQPLVETFLHSSDVFCGGTFVEPAIVINDSEDSQASLVASLQAQDDIANPFLEEINQGTQALGESTVTTFRQYELRSVRQSRDDRAHLVEVKQLSKASSSKRKEDEKLIRPCSKRSESNKAKSIKYLDDDSEGNEISLPAHESPVAHDILNDDFSIFLSSELMELDYECPQVMSETIKISSPFTHVKQSTSASQMELPREITCFVIQLQRVSFEKDRKFQLYLTLQQFSLYNIIISGDSIRSMLNIPEIQFASVLNLLNFVEKYDYTVGEKQQGRSSDAFVTIQLDSFFTNQIRFKTFQLLIDGENYSCIDANYTSNSNIDLTSAISEDILREMKMSLQKC